MVQNFSDISVTISIAVSIFCISLPKQDYDQIKEKAKEHALLLGMTRDQWEAMRRGSEHKADLMMAFDPEGERLLIAKEQEKQKDRKQSND